MNDQAQPLEPTTLEESPFFKEARIPRPEDVRDPSSISLHLMVKNGASVVGRLIDNVGPYVNEVVAVLNDCTDDTEEVLRRHCEGLLVKAGHDVVSVDGKNTLGTMVSRPARLEIIRVTRDTHPQLYILDEKETYEVGRPLADETFGGPFTGKPILADWSAARNLGWSACKGKWRLFLDADDVVTDPECLPGLVKILEEQGVELAASTYHFSVDAQGRTRGTSFRERLALNTPRVRWVRPIHEVLQGTTRVCHVKGNLVVRDLRDSKGADIRIPARNFKILYQRARSRDWDVGPRIFADLIMELKQQPPTAESVRFADALLAKYMRDATWPEERGWVNAMVGEMHEGLHELISAGEVELKCDLFQVIQHISEAGAKLPDDAKCMHCGRVHAEHRMNINHLDKALELYDESLLIHPGSKTAFRMCRARFKKACVLKEQVAELEIKIEDAESMIGPVTGAGLMTLEVAFKTLKDAWRSVIAAYDLGVANKAVHQVLDDGALAEETEKIHVAGALMELGEHDSARFFLVAALATFPENSSLAQFKAQLDKHHPPKEPTKESAPKETVP